MDERPKARLQVEVTMAFDEYIPKRNRLCKFDLNSKQKKEIQEIAARIMNISEAKMPLVTALKGEKGDSLRIDVRRLPASGEEDGYNGWYKLEIQNNGKKADSMTFGIVLVSPDATSVNDLRSAIHEAAKKKFYLVTDG